MVTMLATLSTILTAAVLGSLATIPLVLRAPFPGTSHQAESLVSGEFAPDALWARSSSAHANVDVPAGTLTGSPDSSGSTAVAAGPTIVSGTIATDTTWTKAGSPYHLVGDVEFLQGTRFTIEPGVQVLAGEGVRLTVRGSLHAVGTWDEPILFSKLGSGKWAGLDVYTTGEESASIQNSIVEHATIGVRLTLGTVLGSGMRFVGNTVRFNDTGVVTRAGTIAEPWVSHNLILSNGIGIENGTSLSFNTVVGNTLHGLLNPCSVRWSIISYNGGDGIHTESVCEITGNTIVGNGGHGIAWTWGGTGHINRNNLVGNRSGYDAWTSSPYGGDAENNWWGTTDIAGIFDRIWDFYDDSAAGIVRFYPFLTQPARIPLVNNRFEYLDMFGWQQRSIKGGIARVETLGSCFGANNTQGITFPDGERALNVRSSPGAPVDSVGVATSAPFTLGSAVTFQALSENDDAVPHPDPVSFQVRILEPITSEVWASFDVKTNLLTTSPGTTNDGCLVGEPRNAPWSTHRIDTSPWAGRLARLEFRQHTNVPGKGFFTLIDDIVVEE